MQQRLSVWLSSVQNRFTTFWTVSTVRVEVHQQLKKDSTSQLISQLNKLAATPAKNQNPSTPPREVISYTRLRGGVEPLTFTYCQENVNNQDRKGSLCCAKRTAALQTACTQLCVCVCSMHAAVCVCVCSMHADTHSWNPSGHCSSAIQRSRLFMRLRAAA